MSVTATRTHQGPLARARFDPRAVLAGFALLLVVNIGGWTLAQVNGDQRDDVAVPVARICSEGGTAGAQLAEQGACAAADSTGSGPYVSQVGANGRNGADGDDGQPGADSTTPGPAGVAGADSTVPGPAGAAGTPGLAGAAGLDGSAGADGQDGTDGASPACLAEPGQCRGPEGAAGAPGKEGSPGRDGQDGATGPPGPACPDGTTLRPVTFASGETGLGCVSTEQTGAPAT